MNRLANLSPRLLAFAAVASALALTGCGGASRNEELAQQVEIAKQAAERAVAAQAAAEAALARKSSSPSLTGTGFRKETGDEPKFGAPTDTGKPGGQSASTGEKHNFGEPGGGGGPAPDSMPPPIPNG